MKSSFFIAFLLLLFQQVDAQTAVLAEVLSKNSTASIKQELQTIMDRYTRQGIPGAAIAVSSQELGDLTLGSGYARLEDSTTMKANHLQYLQSVSKTYMAICILQLKDAGKLSIDEKITKYLPARYSKHIRDADKISVRMLLNHTSGIPEYSTNPSFVSFVVEHPLQLFSTENQLQSISGLPSLFVPGSRYAYTNTNYLLLALIADAVTGDHAEYVTTHIFKPLGLDETHYRGNKKYLDRKELVNSYWDVLDTKHPANITVMQKTNVSSMIGDDGIVCSPADAVKLINALMEGRLLSANSLAEMQHWVKDDQGNSRYGLGLAYYQIGPFKAYGHGGGGLGGGCLLLYFPDKKMSVFLSVNLGVLIHSGLTQKVDEMRDELLQTLLK